MIPSQIHAWSAQAQSSLRRGRTFSAFLVVIVASSFVACGGSAPQGEVKAPEPKESAVSEKPAEAPPPPVEAEVSGPSAIPQKCDERSKEFCLPAPRWVKKLCADVHPDVALHLFHKSAPFSHGYLTRKTKAVNASGGVTSGAEYLAFDEEVVLLFHRGASSGGIQVSGEEGGFDALRWDGSCVTLDSNEVTLSNPPSAKFAHIEWRFLGEETQEALKANEKIREAFIARKKECKGAYSGDVSKACVQRDEALTKIIVSEVKAGAVTLPEPKKRP